MTYTRAPVPPLPYGCNSWVVVSKATGKPVFETYTQGIAESVNTTSYEVLTALAWLQRLNREMKQGRNTLP